MQNKRILLELFRRLSIPSINAFHMQLFVALVAIGVILSVSSVYLHTSFPYTHDGENHLARFANYALALREGQFPPRIGPNLHNRYGYPVFNYNYPLANILSVPFSIIDINYESTFSVQVVIAVASAWLGSFLIVKKHQYGLVPATVLASAYATAPYFTTALLYRGNIGEIWIFALLPWLYLSCTAILHITHVFIRARSRQLAHLTRAHIAAASLLSLATVLVWTAFLLAHNLGVLISIPTLLAFALLTFKKHAYAYGVALLHALAAAGLTLWFWLPAVAEKSLITLDNVALSTQFLGHFVTIQDLLFGAQQFGFSMVGPIDSLVPSLGLPFVLLLAIYAAGLFINLFMSRSSKLLAGVILFLLTVTTLFLTSFYSEQIWKLIPSLWIIQFPWRLLVVIPILIIVGLTYSLKSIPKTLIVIIMIAVLAQVTVVLKSSPADRFHKTNEDYQAFTMTTSTQNENLPKTFMYKDIADWKPAPSVLAGDARISVKQWRGSSRTYTIEVVEESIITEPTMYFAGWESTKMSSDSTNTEPIQYIDSEEIGGRIAYRLLPGTYTIHSTFTQHTWPRLVGNSVSVLTFLCLWSVYSYSFFSLWKSKYA